MRLSSETIKGQMRSMIVPVDRAPPAHMVISAVL
jgi:hypothetical protein